MSAGTGKPRMYLERRCLPERPRSQPRIKSSSAQLTIMPGTVEGRRMPERPWNQECGARTCRFGESTSRTSGLEDDLASQAGSDEVVAQEDDRSTASCGQSAGRWLGIVRADKH